MWEMVRFLSHFVYALVYVKPIINLINDMVKITSSFCLETILMLNLMIKVIWKIDISNDIAYDMILDCK